MPGHILVSGSFARDPSHDFEEQRKPRDPPMQTTTLEGDGPPLSE